MVKEVIKGHFALELEGIIGDTIKWYKHLHENPELSFAEIGTSNYIYEEIKKIIGVDELTRPTKTSVMAVIKGEKAGKTIAFRADIDALPITEEAEVEYRSKTSGVMHACGHDAHTSMLLSALKILVTMKNKISGEIRFLFQHAEELPPGGAVAMIEAGVMKGVDYVFAFHIGPMFKTGTMVYKEGICFAASDNFHIKVIGSGIHASMPHLSIDPIVIGAQIVNNLQIITSRNIDPLLTPVVSVTAFHGGTTAHNIIPESAIILGTVRSLDKKVREEVKSLMFRIAENTAAAHGAKCEVKWEYGYSVGHNNKEALNIMLEAFREFLPEERIIDQKVPMFGGEDFTAFQEKANGCMVFMGTGDSDAKTEYPLHSAKFKMDFNAFQYGIAGFLHIAKRVCFK